jgi:tetratricopeptide (TPR) repeat protein
VGNYSGASEFYQKALAIFESTLGKSHSEVAEVLNNIGLVDKKRGNYQSAKVHYEKALRVCSEACSYFTSLSG